MLELSRSSVSIRSKMSLGSAILAWFRRNRTSVRVAFALRLVTMAGGAIFSLLWTRLLVYSMGDALYGLYQNFQALARLGGLGDLGISGALSLKAGQLLGSGDESGLRKLLASARSLFLFLACALFALFVALSPWLPRWLNFDGVAGAGSMPLLFLYGGLSMGAFIIAGYFASLNYAHGTVTWPILPTMVLGQVLAPFLHWRLAVLHTPLWMQNLPYLVSLVATAFLAWRMLKWSHPWLGNLYPLEYDRSQWKILGSASWWTYMITIGTAIYFTTDRLVIGAVIGQAVIPKYQLNYRVCDLALTVIVTAAFVSLPKITQWIFSPHEADRQRALIELDRLSRFEIVLTSIATLAYLAFNNLFISVWLDRAHQAPLAWQFAFAANLAVSCGGNAGIQLAARAGDKGLRSAGISAVATGLLNLCLSILSVKAGPKFGLSVETSIAGVAVATVIAQSIASIYLGSITCRYLGISTFRWTARCWLLPICLVFMAAALKEFLPDDSFAHLLELSACYLILLLVVCWLAGLNRELIRTEFMQIRTIVTGGSSKNQPREQHLPD